jgi:hypothetical protein
MRKILSLLVCSLLMILAEAQKPTRLPTRPTTGVLQPVTVDVFEDVNFTGAFQSYGLGTHRLVGPPDLNDRISSIKVPKGYVVMIYEHANEAGGMGSYTDLMEDCPDLAVYNLSDKVSYLSVFTAEKAGGYVWVRARNVNNKVVPGHWERKRASGVVPDNSPPAVVIALYERDDAANAPDATQAEIDEFNDVVTHQMGVGVLGGETTTPIYYHHNQPNEEVYKYEKIIDPSRLPGAFFDWAAEKLGRAGIILKPFEAVTDFVGDVKDWIFGSSSTKVGMDTWYPVSEHRTTVCGSATKDASICTQDYLHTQVTIDKDVCLHITPSEKFRPVLSNRWTGETSTDIEAEVKFKNLVGSGIEGTTPRNPLLLQTKKDEKVCVYGPWMGDVMNLTLNVPIPFSDSKVELGNLNLRKNNEIHPVNQAWKRNGKEWQLIAVADGTGYFQKKKYGEIEASGLNQRMRFYIAFLLSAGTGINSNNVVYDINGIGFDFAPNPAIDIQPESIELKNQGVSRVKVNAHSVVRLQRTFKVFFDKVRKRPNGAIQGYVVVETEPITTQGGSMNIIVKDQSPESGLVRPVRPTVGEVIRN